MPGPQGGERGLDRGGIEVAGLAGEQVVGLLQHRLHFEERLIGRLAVELIPHAPGGGPCDLDDRQAPVDEGLVLPSTRKPT